MPWRRMTQGRCGCTQANFASSIVAPGKDKNWDLCSSRARTSWPFKVGTKRRYGITTLNYVISQKSADLIYTAAQAWIVSRNTKSTPLSQTQMLAVPGDTEICNFNMKYTSHWVLRIKITTFRVLFCICGNSEASFVSIFPGIHTEILLSVAAWTSYSYMTSRGCQTARATDTIFCIAIRCTSVHTASDAHPVPCSGNTVPPFVMERRWDENWHWPPPNNETKNEWSYNSTPHVFMTCKRKNLLLHSIDSFLSIRKEV